MENFEKQLRNDFSVTDCGGDLGCTILMAESRYYSLEDLINFVASEKQKSLEEGAIGVLKKLKELSHTRKAILAMGEMINFITERDLDDLISELEKGND